MNRDDRLNSIADSFKPTPRTPGITGSPKITYYGNDGHSVIGRCDGNSKADLIATSKEQYLKYQSDLYDKLEMKAAMRWVDNTVEHVLGDTQ
jgi:hypothetical protein